MKSVLFAAASLAALASAHVARSPLDLGLAIGDLVKVDLCLGLDIKLPLGISLDTPTACPKHGPPSDCVNVWHPPHHIPIDGCDSCDDSEWHYVHPCRGGNCGHYQRHRWTTSTITEKSINTVVGCAPDVYDCPGRSTVQTVVSVPATTTVCPVPYAANTPFNAPAPAAPYNQPQIQPQAQPVVTPIQSAPYAAPAPQIQQQPQQTYVPAPAPQQQPAIAQYPSAQPPIVQAPNQQPSIAPYPTNVPAVVPAQAPYNNAPYNNGPAPAPVATGAPYNAYPNNNTSPVHVGAAPAHGQKLGLAAAAAALGLVAVLVF